MKILVTGNKGYIGFPLVIQILEQSKHSVVGVDNDSRNKWTEITSGVQTTQDADCEYSDRFIGIDGDLTNRDFVNEILAIHKPDVVIHLASQPSMPYSQINGERASFTQFNNLSMCTNLLWGIKELGLPARLVITTTTGIPGQSYKLVPEENTLNLAGSWYHTSRGFDSANCNLASRQWGQEVLELRTAIVYGVQTQVMKDVDAALVTRFDTDTYFGTALNRFVQQATGKKPITIYGKGLQTKPFISLEDTVQSLFNAIDYKVKSKHTIFNQVTDVVSIKKLAKTVQKYTECNIVHIPNPRKEKETFRMKFDNSKFLELLFKTPEPMDVEIKNIVDWLRNDSKSRVTYTWNYPPGQITGKDVWERTY